MEQINSQLQLNPTVIDNTGWTIPRRGWTRLGDHSFRVADTQDSASFYRKGVKIRYKQGGAYEYGVILSSTTTNVGGFFPYQTDVTLIPNTDYAMASGSVTDSYVSFIDNPESFPSYFNFDPAWTNVSGGTKKARWKVYSSSMIFLELTNVGCTHSGNIDFTVPVTPVGVADVTRMILGVVQMLNSGVGQWAGQVNGTPTSALVHPRVLDSSGTYAEAIRITGSVPFTFGASDELNIQCNFMF